MKPNIGNADGAIRILLGLGLFLFLLLAPAHARWWGLLGFIPLLTAFFGTCPLYSLIGFDTRGSPDARSR
jgi:Protein of unknown function (DUF2892)